MQVEHMPVSMGWRLPDNSRVRVVYNSRVVAYEESKDRWLVILEEVIGDSDMTAQHAETRDLIASLAGKWAYVPDAAREGVTLPLKYETLTGKIRFFYAQDPRKS